MKSIKLSRGSVAVPEQWAEVKEKPLINAMVWQLNYQLAEGDDAKARWRLRMLCELTGIKKEALKRLTDLDIYKLLSAVQWSLTTKLDCLPFTSFSHRQTTYYLPKPKFSDTSAGEVSLANMYYLSYTNPQQPNPKALFLLIATLCRPRRSFLKLHRLKSDYNGDDREEFNSITAEKRAQQLENMPVGIMLAVLQYFEYMNNEFVTRYADVFEEDPSMRPLFQHGEGWLALLEDVAEAAPFGNYESVFAKNVHTIWIYLRHKKIRADREAEEQEKILEESRNQ